MQGPGGRPIANAVLTLTDFAGQQVSRGVSDGVGGYAVPVPSGGSYVLVCAAEGHQPAASVVPVGPNGARRDFTLAGGSRVDGRVLRPGGAGVAGATVTLIDVRGEVTGAAGTDAEGRFVLPGLNPGDYTLTATADDSLPLARALTVEGTVTQTVELVLPSNVRIAGTVRAARSGRPVLDASVTVIDAEGNVVGRVLTEEDGRYEFTGLTPGAYTLTASGYAPVAVPVQLSADGDDKDLLVGNDLSAEAPPVPSSVPVAAWDRG